MHHDDNDNEEFIDDAEDVSEARRAGILTDSLRRALVSGLSTVLMTEEGIRQAVSEVRLPKDAIGYITQQAERSRKELMRIVSEEVKGFLHDTDMAGLLRKSLSGMKVEVRAELKFHDESGGPEVKVSRARAKTRADADDAAE